MSKSNFFFGVIIFLLFLIQGIFLLPDYGMNWDEPAHYLRGQAYLRFFLTGAKDYKEFPQLKSHLPKSEFVDPPQYKWIVGDDSVFRRSIFQYDRGEGEKFTYFYYLKYDKGHPPLNGILASLSNYIFYQRLGVFKDIESYHLFTIFLSAILAASIFIFTSRFYGKFAGLVAVLSLSLFPLFFAESHFNIKDPVESSFYSLALFAFYIGVVKGKWKWIIISGVFAGFALGTKFNIIFASFSLAVWLAIYHWRSIKRVSWPFSKSQTASFVLYPFIALSILYISWPYLWQDSKNIMHIFSYYREIGIVPYQPPGYYFFGFNTYAVWWLLFSTPLVILFYCFFGIFYVLKYGLSEKNKLAIFIFLWLLVPVVRVSFSTTGIYGGLRQIMEFIPAMAILSGIGANYLVQSLKFKIFNFKPQLLTFIFKLLIIASFIPITIKLISIHPNQNVYFNPFIGGLKGAYERNFPDWGVSLGSVYQQGTDWLNQNAERGATLALVRVLHSNIPRTKLRQDINFDNRYYSGEQRGGEYIMEVIDYNWVIHVPREKRKYLENLESVYSVKVDEVSILKIWKND